MTHKGWNEARNGLNIMLITTKHSFMVDYLLVFQL